MENTHRELLLLGLLRRQEMHGYQLNEFINQDLASCSDLKKPTAYFLLNKMAERGWITQQQEQEGNRPPRHVYQLTEHGEAEFQRLLRHNLATYTPIHFPGDAGLPFLDAIPPQETLALLKQRLTALSQTLADMQAAPTHPGSTHWVIEHQLRHLQAEIEWLDEIIRRLETASQRNSL